MYIIINLICKYFDYFCRDYYVFGCREIKDKNIDIKSVWWNKKLKLVYDEKKRFV